MKRIFPQEHQPIPFVFRQTRDDFIVVEEGLFDTPANKGNQLIVKIQKQDLSTMEMLNILESELRCQNIGYAGLKDKHATTTQYISMPLKYSKSFEKFYHPKLKVIESFLAKDKISIGDLKGNNFFIRLKEVSPESAERLAAVLDEIMRQGIPNYFGYQRFGRDSDNFEKARDVAQGEEIMKDNKVHKIMLHAYQSYLFNDWLAKRVALSKEIKTKPCEELLKTLKISQTECEQMKNQAGLFTVLPGDVMMDFQSQKWINVTDLDAVRKPYKEHKMVPTGLLAGSKAWRAKGVAGEIEHHFDDFTVDAAGTRREAWIYPKSIRHKYKKNDKIFELSFTLPKGAYATVLLENLANRDLSPQS